MTRFRFTKTTDKGAVAAIDIPIMHPGGYLGAMRVSGAGDDTSEALAVASSIAGHIASDPVLSAIIPPYAKIALTAVDQLNKAYNAGGNAAAQQVLDKYNGPGVKRVADALNKTSDKSKSSSTSAGFYGLPSDTKDKVGDYDGDNNRRNRRGALRYYDYDTQDGANYGNEIFARAMEEGLSAGDDACTTKGSMGRRMLVGGLDIGDLAPESFDPTNGGEYYDPSDVSAQYPDYESAEYSYSPYAPEYAAPQFPVPPSMFGYQTTQMPPYDPFAGYGAYPPGYDPNNPYGSPYGSPYGTPPGYPPTGYPPYGGNPYAPNPYAPPGYGPGAYGGPYGAPPQPHTPTVTVTGSGKSGQRYTGLNPNDPLYGQGAVVTYQPGGGSTVSVGNKQHKPGGGYK